MDALDVSNSKGSFDSQGSGYLKERRAKQLEQERILRSRMKRIGSPDTSGGGLSLEESSSSIDGSVETSLISLTLSRNSGKNKNLNGVKWENVPVEFAFGLLTSKEEAPRKGYYHGKRSTRRSDESISTKSSSKLLESSSILRQIMKKVGELSKMAVLNRTGNVIIKAKSPYIESVLRDSK